MDSKKKISISFRNEHQKDSKREVVRTQSEQAAAAEEKKDEQRPSTPVYQLPLKKKKKHFSSFKPLIATSLTALFVSLGLGFLLLRMFVSLTDDTSMGSQANDTMPVTSPGEQQTAENSADSLPEGALQTFNAYIVQAGAFSTETKALEWKSRLTAQSVSSVVWERDGQFYLYVGSGATKQEADLIASELAAESIETYVKPWVVNVEKQVPDKVYQHLDAHSLGDFSESDRQKVMEEIGKNTPLAQALSEWEAQDDTNVNWLKVAKSLE
ncbi:SPOR domain-containing protein [Halobacillus litoralis]|uniref:SPOR domain-containing protein n=1 Tax=Halobacillus litoralis TaxID=45668 RepID=UPI002490F5CF|nr:SPOR domain-containing protein [Halobacillus litoralis]